MLTDSNEPEPNESEPNELGPNEPEQLNELDELTTDWPQDWPELTLPFEIDPPAIANPIYLRHRAWMIKAIALAHTAANAGEVPVAAIVVGPNNQPIAYAANRKERDHDPTGHAEVLALRAAGRQLGNWHLNECVLYVTLEPCMMCAGAIVQSRLGLLVYGAYDSKAGAVRSVLNLPDSQCSNHKLSVLSGILEAPCRHQLQTWFQRKRQRSS